MTKRSLSFHLLVLIPLLAACRGAGDSTVCAGPADVRTAANVHALAGCTAIDGDLRIVGSELADLRGLERLGSVRFLVIAGNDRLTDLSGLSGLREAAGVTVVRNEALLSLRGLEGLDRVEGLWIERNGSLTSLDGLSGLLRADETVIVSNPRLATLAGLSTLAHVEELELSANPALPSGEVESLRRRTLRPIALGHPEAKP